MLSNIYKYLKKRNKEFDKYLKINSKYRKALEYSAGFLYKPIFYLLKIIWFTCPSWKIKCTQDIDNNKNLDNSKKYKRKTMKKQKTLIKPQYQIETNIELGENTAKEWESEEQIALKNDSYFLEQLIKHIITPLLEKGLIENAIQAFFACTNLNYNQIISKIKENYNICYSETQINNIISNSLTRDTNFKIDIENSMYNELKMLEEILTRLMYYAILWKLHCDSYRPFIESTFITKGGNFEIEKFNEAIEEREQILTTIKNSEIYNNLKDEDKKFFNIEYIKLSNQNYMIETNIEFYQSILEAADVSKENYLETISDLTKFQKELIQLQEFLKKVNELSKTEIIISKKENSIENFYYNALMLSIYPILWQKEIEIDYSPENKMLVINYKLPTIDDMPIINTNNKPIGKKEHCALYNDIICQICLRTINELFTLDNKNNIHGITFNGFISTIDKATGNNKTTYIMSLQTEKNKFSEINLEHVDAQECFKYLKGIGAPELFSITPIIPIRKINKADKRFIEAYGILDNINSKTNIAAMDWKDFENLIREVFEKEFSNNGGEVKITQASRDGGVDAIAYDPDPIKGGKIIIQAKRYTNIVGVSAVRDLYGTIMNEGANSGILITTSDYGVDSYEFANGKPIKLLNGAELLGLMNKHGYQAYININEARKLI